MRTWIQRGAFFGSFPKAVLDHDVYIGRRARHDAAILQQQNNPDFADQVRVPSDPREDFVSKHAYAIGRCNRCEGRHGKVGMGWKKGLATLKTMRCPRCGGRLSQTTLALQARFAVIPEGLVKRLVKAGEKHDAITWDMEAAKANELKDNFERTIGRIVKEIEAPLFEADRIEQEANEVKWAAAAEDTRKRRIDDLANKVWQAMRNGATKADAEMALHEGIKKY